MLQNTAEADLSSVVVELHQFAKSREAEIHYTRVARIGLLGTR
jgi:hypothetical protein